MHWVKGRALGREPCLMVHWAYGLWYACGAQAVANGPAQVAVAIAIEQINEGDLAAAQQLLDALLERPLSSLLMKERLGVYLARGTSRAMLAREGQLQGALSRKLESKTLDQYHELLMYGKISSAMCIGVRKRRAGVAARKHRRCTSCMLITVVNVKDTGSCCEKRLECPRVSLEGCISSNII